MSRASGELEVFISWAEGGYIPCLLLKNDWGTWVAQLVKHPTLGFGSVHDLRAVRLSPAMGSTLGAEAAAESLPLPLLSLCSSLFVPL